MIPGNIKDGEMAELMIPTLERRPEDTILGINLDMGIDTEMGWLAESHDGFKPALIHSICRPPQVMGVAKAA